MALFNTDIDYQGQDLHVVRNGLAFPLYKFFGTPSNLSYEIRLTGQKVLQYENINVNIPANNEIVITANTYDVSLGIEKVSSFFIIVSDAVTDENAAILIHLHDSLDNVWVSPQKLTLRPGMEVRFGILANFADANYADLSFYPDLTTDPKPGVTNITLTTELPKRIKWVSSPSSNPIENAVTITLPEWMENSNSQTRIRITGDLEMLENPGELKLHTGEIKIEEIQKRINILLLSDGFTSKSSFQKIVADYQSELFKKDTYTPWNLFANKINIWSYYLEDQEEVSSLEGEFIILQNNTICDLSNTASVSLREKMQDRP